jgi:hypothetical protein
LHIFRSFWRTRKPYYGMLSVITIVGGIAYAAAVLGLGFELFRIEISIKLRLCGMYSFVSRYPVLAIPSI